MKKSITLTLAVVCTYVYAQGQLSPEITSWITTAGAGDQFDAVYSNVQQVQYTDQDVFLSCYGIPTYDVGPWDDPSLGVNQNFVFRISRSPEATADHTPLEIGRIGIWSNGISIYDPRNGVSYRADDVWHLDAVRAGADAEVPCDGSAAANGEFYSYTPASCLFDPNSSTEHAPIIGYAFDGFPIYGGYGYANADGTGDVVRMRSSYQFRNITERTTLPDGSQLPESLHGPAVNDQYPLGHYVEDYIYAAGSGDLDAHNGRFCVTPEYPNGTYAYFTTIDANGSPAYPYVIGDSFYGRVIEGNIGEFQGHQTIDASATTYASIGGDAGIEILCYPNPSTDYFHVYILPSFENDITAVFSDMHGHVVFAEHNWQPGVKYAIDVRHLSSGMYILQLTSGEERVIQKCFVRN